MTDPDIASRPFPLREAYAADVRDVLARLHVEAEHGLDPAEVRRRQQQFGPNLLRETRQKAALSILYDQVKSLIVVLLAVAAALSMLFGQWTEGAAIAVVTLINTAIGFVTEIRAIRSMEALRRLSVVTARVRRNGQVTEIASRQLVPGDVVIVEAGDIVSADLRLIAASRLRCDESVLTGESMPVTKSAEPVARATALPDRVNMAYQGTALTTGSAEGVVVATGMATELGQIAALAEEAEEPATPLEQRLAFLSRQLVWVTLLLVAAIGAAGILTGKPPLLMIETAIALAVAAVPEGLPMVATLALARGMWRMARRNALIERLPAVETLGAVTVILTDKTGTLTENRMTVTRLVLPSGDFEVIGDEFRRGGEPFVSFDDPAFRTALETGMLCNNASLSPDPDCPGELRIVGDPMDGALLVLGDKAGIRRADLIEVRPEMREEAFDPHLKMMATVHRADGRFAVAVKGAPEAVLACSGTILSDGGTAPLSDAVRDTWHRTAETLAGEGLRVLALATKTTESAEGTLYRDLTFVGLAGFHDPPRSGVADAMATCRDAGIRVVMVTGDHAVTASQIANTVGLTRGDAPAPVEGKDLSSGGELSEGERERLLRIPVFARVSPRQKLDLIALYQSDGAVVAMTGDGVNDAPALRRADIGIAMGHRGSQVAREAADIVLQDDRFETIVAAIAQGRVIFANIRRFILYLLSCNFSEIMIVGIASLSGMPLPILPLQILFLNLVTDVFPAFALGAGEGEADIMKRRPRPPKEALLPGRLWLSIMVYGGLITAATLAAFAIALYGLAMSNSAAVTVSFLTLAMAQLWHVFNMRDTGSSFLRNEITQNRYIWGALALCALLLLAAVYSPGISDVLGLAPPSPAGWAVAVGLSFLPFIAGQAVKAIPRRAAARLVEKEGKD